MRLKLFFKTIPSIQGSHQNKVCVPSPTSRPTLVSNYRPPPTPAPFLILIKLFHQTELNCPSSTIIPPTSLYRDAKTLYHKLLFSTLIRQHHLASNTKLNSLILRTAKPPFSFLEQIVSQLIQEIFLTSSHPPKKNN